MKVNFTIDEDYLLAHTLDGVTDSRFSSENNRDDVTALRDKFRLMLLGFHNNELEEMIYVGKKLDKIYGARQTQEFAAVLEQTEAYKRKVEREWNENHLRSLEAMDDVTGLSFDGEYTVFLTHPSLRNGRYFGNRKIGWGVSGEFPNYSTVYLWHEGLHDKIESDDVGHSIIELATDNELRVRLNGGQYPEFVGHKDLFELMGQMLPDWRTYLAAQDRNILDFYRRMRQKHGES